MVGVKNYPLNAVTQLTGGPCRLAAVGYQWDDDRQGFQGTTLIFDNNQSVRLPLYIKSEGLGVTDWTLEYENVRNEGIQSLNKIKRDHNDIPHNFLPGINSPRQLQIAYESGLRSSILGKVDIPSLIMEGVLPLKEFLIEQLNRKISEAGKNKESIYYYPEFSKDSINVAIIDDNRLHRITGHTIVVPGIASNNELKMYIEQILSDNYGVDRRLHKKKSDLEKKLDWKSFIDLQEPDQIKI
jgi:hypothetical protein